MKEIAIKCKNCPYYTGVECHGHGEFYGICTIFQDKIKVMEMLFQKLDGDNALFLSYKGGAFSDVCNDDSSCKFFVLKDYRK